MTIPFIYNALNTTSVLDAVLSLVAPHICLQCGEEGSLWCGLCRTSALPTAARCYKCHAVSAQGRTCVRCRRTSPLHSVQAATRYEGTAKQLIWQLKFERARAAALPVATIMASRITLPANTLIVPVPTSTNRVRQRGYDQAVLVARTISSQLHLPLVTALIRLGSQQQHTATRAQRLTQLQRAFIATRPDLVRGKHVLLVDDVITTGATLEAAASTLKAAGAKRVLAAVFAQA